MGQARKVLGGIGFVAGLGCVVAAALGIRAQLDDPDPTPDRTLASAPLSDAPAEDPAGAAPSRDDPASADPVRDVGASALRGLRVPPPTAPDL